MRKGVRLIAIVCVGLLEGDIAIICVGLLEGDVAALRAQEPTNESVRKHLQSRYQFKVPQRAGELQFEPDSDVVELKPAGLTRSLPGTRFYRTKFLTGHYEYMHVVVLVMARVVDGRLVTRECLSPGYSEASPEFLAQFRGIAAKTHEERKALVGEIGELFRQITYQGRLSDCRPDGNCFRIDLYHGENFWRVIEVTFNQHGLLELIAFRKSGER